MTTAIIPERQREPLWAAYHGLPAAGHEMRAAVVIEPVQRENPKTLPEIVMSWMPPDYRVTSGQKLEAAQ